MHPGELASLLATSSAMSETIPPSLVLITIGSVMPGLSIAALFTGGLLPAFVAALALVVVAWWRSRNSDAGAGERAPVSVILRTFVIAVPGLTLPFVIRFAVIKGIATATEVSTVGVVYTALLGLLVYRQFDWRRLYPILVETVSLTGAVMMIIGTATGDGLGADPIGLFAVAGVGDGGGAGRQLGLPRDHDRRVHHSRQRAGGNAGDRAVRAAAVPGRQGNGRARGALCDGGDPGDGDRPVRAAVWGWVLRRLRDRPH